MIKRWPFRIVLFCLIVVWTVFGAQEKTQESGQYPNFKTTIDASVYDRAARFLPENLDVLVLNGTVTPHWRDDKHDRFTYRRNLGEGRAEFVAVDAATGARHKAFNHNVIADGLAKAMGKPVESDRLPFSDYEEVGPNAIRFTIQAITWTCSTVNPSCQSAPATRDDPAATASPDGKWLAFLENHNLWVRSADGRERFPLTKDGHADFAYGVYPAWAVAEVLPTGDPVPPAVVWSPDSRLLYTQRVDERSVGTVTIVESTPPDGSPRPKAFSFRYPFSTDASVPMVDYWVFDVASRHGVRVDIDPVPSSANLLFEKLIFWSPDSREAFAVVRSRYAKKMTLYAVDPASGRVRVVVSETGATFLEPNGLLARPMVVPLVNGDVVWYSERDAHGHLYLYDGQAGRLKRRLTEGDWSVQGIMRYAPAQGLLYVSIGEREPGSDPLYLRLYSLRVSDGRLQLLTPEDASHDIAWGGIPAAFSPSGRYFVDTFSRPDQPPRTVLRRADGRLIAEVEHADVSRLTRGGLTVPERFSAIAADGRTRLYGTILRPSDFDPRKLYAVIDQIYGGPQSVRAYPGFLDNVFDDSFAQTVAELGFIVVIVDGRGTPGRSKAFHDEQYGRMEKAGYIEDHVAVIRELATRYPYMDLGRVGIYGSSAGGYAALRALLAYPDFYKAAVADASGDGWVRTSMDAWGEIFNGPEQGSNYLDTANAPLAPRLRGKLFLIHGEMDTITPVSVGALRFVDALVKANKDFEFLIVPNAGHTTLTATNASPEVYHYVLRRAWDFFVRSLMNAQPPQDYDLGKTCLSGSKAATVH